MTKKQYVIALFSACTMTGTGYAANPATKEYVDSKVAILQSEIAAIPAGKQGPVGPQGVPGPQGA
ncbi:TPA: collagen-like protein, partial [Legionella anisa]